MNTVKVDYAKVLHKIPLGQVLSQRYLSYALSTITARSLPDVRDGLKPVHRRLLYAMLELKLNPSAGFKKCARIVGDVMGKYHPHGDSAIYDAMVRLAQSFSVRYPLVDGQGNFGNVDGDNAAAMRYTEARLTKFAQEMLRDIDKNTVDFNTTYDGESVEPSIFPSAVPNLLANGSSGIAVGMATNIPPHNMCELCDALLCLIKEPNASIHKLMQYVKGPDFPTGGTVAENADTLLAAYSTGRGSLRVRARWTVEHLEKGLWQIVVTEIPYQVQKSKLIEKIAQNMEEKNLPLLADVRDESAENIRLILEPKSRNVEANILMETLFKYTDLETRFSLNMNVLSNRGRVPKVLSVGEVLREYLHHRQEILIRACTHDKEKIERRIQILQGYITVFLNLERVITIIREEDDPQYVLMKTFSLSELQVKAILDMRLRSLKRLEEKALKSEYTMLEESLQGLEDLLGDEQKRLKHIAEDIKALKGAYGHKTELGKRRTSIVSAPKPVQLDALVDREPITIVCSKNGWVRALRGHVAEISDIKYKEGDSERFVVKAHTTDKLFLFSSSGKFYTLNADILPSGRGHGEPLSLLLEIQKEDSIVVMRLYRPGKSVLLASSDGRGFVAKEDDLVAQTRNGKQVLTLGKGEKSLVCVDCDGDSVAVVGTNRKMLIFDLAYIPTMKKGRGIILQKYKKAKLSDIKVFAFAKGLTWMLGKRMRTETNLIKWQGNRAGIGKAPPAGFSRKNTFS